jgi:hypothetical protein
VSHVINQSPKFANRVGDLQPITSSHAGGMNLVLIIDTRVQQPTYAIHVGDFSTTSKSHVEDKKTTTSSHVGGIDFIEKTRKIGHDPKLPCNI